MSVAVAPSRLKKNDNRATKEAAASDTVDLLFHFSFLFNLVMLILKRIWSLQARATDIKLRCIDTQHNDTQHNDTQHNDTQYNDTRHNNK
jgi:hypothetical protein